MNSVIFDNWQGPARVLIVGVSAYFVLIFFLRISGKRTLSKMNAFDLVVTVALGSTLATILLSSQVSLVEGALAMALLIGLQFMITWLTVRSSRFQKLIKAQPKMLFYQGEFLESALRMDRVTREELMAAVRATGECDLSKIHSIVLETNGNFSVLPSSSAGSSSALTNVIRE